MCTVHIGIGHDDDLMIPQFGNIKIFMDTGTKCSDHGFDLRIAVDSIQTGFLHIQDLSTKRQDRLGCTASRCLGRTAGRIPLYDVDLTVFGIFIRTVCQFSRKRQSFQCRFSSGQITGFSRRISGTLCQYRFVHDGFCHRRILLQKNLQCSAYHSIHGTSRLTVTQLLFRLSFKLRFFNFYTDDGSQTLTDIFPCQFFVFF